MYIYNIHILLCFLDFSSMVRSNKKLGISSGNCANSPHLNNKHHQAKWAFFYPACKANFLNDQPISHQYSMQISMVVPKRWYKCSWKIPSLMEL